MNAEERFWEKVDRRGPDECWLWKGGTTPSGYGVFHPFKPCTVGAHRFSLALSLGRPIEAGMFACHKCDNPPCVNPSHLYEGTNQQNVNDAVSRRRHKHGELGAQKLSDEAVLAIRHLVASGRKSRVVAREYGISESMISGIVRGNKWAHVGGPRTYHYKKEAA